MQIFCFGEKKQNHFPQFLKKIYTSICFHKRHKYIQLILIFDHIFVNTFHGEHIHSKNFQDDEKMKQMELVFLQSRNAFTLTKLSCEKDNDIFVSNSSAQILSNKILSCYVFCFISKIF